MGQVYIINQTIRVDFELNEVQHVNTGLTFQLGANEVELLKFFISHPGQLNSRQTLIEEIWISKGIFVEDGSLMQSISMCRKALQDKNGKLIVTERGKGYRFYAEVEEECLTRSPSDEPHARAWYVSTASLSVLSVMASALLSFVIYGRYHTPYHLPQSLTQSHFSHCQISLEGDASYSLSRGTKYSTATLSLLVDEQGRSFSYPNAFQGVTCYE